jgi:hypothetical protein
MTDKLLIRNVLFEDIHEKRKACPNKRKTKRPWRTKLDKNEPRQPDLLRVMIPSKA